MEINEIVQKLIEAREVYYNSTTPIMSDSEFDGLEDLLREKDPSNAYFTTVGVLPEEATQTGKLVHKIPMLSMGKAKTIGQIEKWIKKLTMAEDQVYCIQPKIDGLSATCHYKNIPI